MGCQGFVSPESPEGNPGAEEVQARAQSLVFPPLAHPLGVPTTDCAPCSVHSPWHLVAPVWATPWPVMREAVDLAFVAGFW